MVIFSTLLKVLQSTVILIDTEMRAQTFIQRKTTIDLDMLLEITWMAETYQQIFTESFLELKMTSQILSYVENYLQP